MTILNFDSFDDMQEHLRKMAEDAERQLAPAQRALTFGSHWVRFVDLANREVEFGYCHTLDEIRASETRLGTPAEEVEQALEQTKMVLDQEHKMFGTAYIFWQPEGELGYTHRVSVWPIDESLFEAAKAHDFNIDGIGVPDKINLEAAWQAYRAHRLGVQA